jgi:hypothetical protein
LNPCLIQQSNIKCDKYKQKDNNKIVKYLMILLYLVIYIPNFSKQKTQVPNHKLKIILIIQNINAEVVQILCYIYIYIYNLVSIIINKIQESHYVSFPWIFGKGHKFDTCFGFSLEKYFSKTPLLIFYLIFSNLIIMFSYELVRFSYEFSKFWNMILKRAIVVRKNNL